MAMKFKLDNSKPVATKEINRTLEIANIYAGELAIEVLALDKIELDPENSRDMVLTLNDALNGIDPSDPEYERKRQDYKSLETLSNTIREDNLINPISVYRFGNKCRLISGERRTLASAIAGKKEIIARVADERPMGKKLRILQWIENNERRDLSLAEQVNNIEAVMNEHIKENKTSGSRPKITAKQLGEMTYMSETQARRFIDIINAPPQIRQAIEQRKIESIKIAHLISTTENESHQIELLHAALSGKTLEIISTLKKELEDNRNKPVQKKIKKNEVNLGVVKPNVVKIIVDALISTTLIDKTIVHQLDTIKGNTEWDNKESIKKSFKKIISLLDRGV